VSNSMIVILLLSVGLIALYVTTIFSYLSYGFHRPTSMSEIKKAKHTLKMSSKLYCFLLLLLFLITAGINYCHIRIAKYVTFVNMITHNCPVHKYVITIFTGNNLFLYGNHKFIHILCCVY
jgi:hypothetical protein